jgi:hypothetical protein
VLARQAEQDRIAAENRTRQRGIESLQVPGQLAEMAGGQDSPEDAQRLIDSLMPKMMELFGQEANAYGQPALEMATRTITGRQKKQVGDFVEAALKTAFVADNADADPEIVSLPAHIAKVIGKPSAKLSELQQFAQLPVGRPAGKERIPAAAGSFEEYSDPKTPGERKAQIERDRKAYMQADDRAPRVTVNTGDSGGLNPNQQALMTERLAKGWADATSSTREVRRQLGLMETGLQRFRSGDKNGGSQAVLVTFQKILDPTSVVRESEYARSAEGISMLGRIQGFADKLQSGGAGVPDAELAAMVETARQMSAQMGAYSSAQRSRLEAMGKKYQIDPVLIFGVEPSSGGGGGAAGGAADPLGIRPKG